MNPSVRRGARKVLAPINHLLDQRLGEVNQRVDGVHGAVAAWAARTGETEELLGRNLSEMAALLDQVVADNEALRALQAETTAHVRALRDELGWLTSDVRSSLAGISAEHADGPATLDRLDEHSADFLNKATGYLGLAAQAGVFVNEPVIVHYETGAVRVTDVNERIVELPFVFRGLAAVPSGASVIDIGSSESTVSLSLASLGHRVTTVDPRGYAFNHPNLAGLADVSEADDGAYDAAVVLSTIEHVGVAHYGLEAEPDADIELMAVLATKLRPGGTLLLTTPFGDGRDGGFQRIYDPERLRALLNPFEVVHVEIAQRHGLTEWRVEAADYEALPVVTDDEYRVAMVVARVKG
jgi:SAM-dependent methyltransferase